MYMYIHVVNTINYGQVLKKVHILHPRAQKASDNQARRGGGGEGEGRG